MSTGAARRASPALVVGALGVVFGDIGTSPLYAFRTVLHDAQVHDGGSVTRADVLGLTSMLVWAMLVVVTLLYVGLLLRNDNEGEGGLLALVALVRRSGGRRVAYVATALGLVGASMFLGDALITPSISVLSAAEGLEVASPSFASAVLPVAVVVLAGVFVLQRAGSGTIGKVYGPVMVLWFAVLALTGLASLVQDPGVLVSLSPTYAAAFVVAHPLTGFLVLGAVILVVTGAEALYADLGHFGRPAIATAWVAIVLPALVLGYLGEASAVLRDPAAMADPFFAVVPGWATIAMVVLSFVATVIASEAVIAGAFTVLHQAGGLGVLPSLRTEHTSRHQAGQIYIPSANWTLAVAVLAVVLVFRSSDALSAAYGVAVATTILITSTLFLVLDRLRHRKVTPRFVAGAFCWVVVLLFVASTVPKIPSGGYVPVGLGVVLVAVMSTWWSGQRRLDRTARSTEGTPRDRLRELAADEPMRVPGTAVFLVRDVEVAPLALGTFVDSSHTLAEQVVLLSWEVADTPKASADDCSVRVRDHGDELAGVVGVHVVLGYRERLDVEHVLALAVEEAPDDLERLDHDAVAHARYFLSEPIPRLARHTGMMRWRQRLFLVLDRLALDPAEQLRLPRERTVTIGRELSL